MTVTFFPWPIGFGHTGRCLIVAKMLKRAGYDCVFATDPTGGWVSREGFRVVSSAPLRRRRSPSQPSGYISVPGLDAAYASAGYYRSERILRDVETDLDTMRTSRADLVVTHMQPTSVIAARRERIPIVSIADADFLLPGQTGWMPWIDGKYTKLSPYPESLPAFNEALEVHGLKTAADVSDLMWNDLVLIASTPDLDPLPEAYELRPSLHYVGPLIWDPAESATGLELADLGGYRPRVYLTLGSGELSTAAVLEASLTAAESDGWALLAAVGHGYAEKARPVPPNVKLLRFGGIRSAIRWSDVVLCHGGHSTILASLLAGKPVGVIPFMSENEANGRAMVEDRGSGIVLCHTEEDPGSSRLRVVPRYRDLPRDPVVSREGLRRAVSEMVNQPRYAEQARREATSLQSYAEEGPTTVRSLVGEILG